MLAILGLATPTAIALAVSLALMHWHRPTTHLKLDLELDRVAFTVARSPPNSPQTLGYPHIFLCLNNKLW